MDTTKPATVDALIDDFVREHRYLPNEAVAVLASDELPLRLQVRIRSIPMDATWRAWSDGCRVWLVIAKCESELRAGVRQVVLKMSFHDQDGACVGSGAWMRHPDGKWRLHQVPADPTEGDTDPSVARASRPTEEAPAAHYRDIDHHGAASSICCRNFPQSS